MNVKNVLLSHAKEVFAEVAYYDKILMQHSCNHLIDSTY